MAPAPSPKVTKETNFDFSVKKLDIVSVWATTTCFALGLTCKYSKARSKFRLKPEQPEVSVKAGVKLFLSTK